MFRKNQLSCAVAAAMGVSLISGTANAALEEIIVTATKTSASAQDIPVAVQAIGSETIDDLGIETFDEYVKYLPNVVQQGRGPGQSEVYIRGVAAEQTTGEIASINGSSPTVAVYLDEQPVALGGRNLDIYAADLERVEVLPGPQGTLFGASSQAGTVRLISNKPQVGEFNGGIKASNAWTTGGEESTATQAFVNIPLMEKLAVRAVFYNDKQGGWIDNVDAQYGSDQGRIDVINRNQISPAASIADTATIARAQNSDHVENNFNGATYNGGRFGISYDINDDWNILVQHTTQTLETEGAFEYSPFLSNHGEEKTAKFSPDQNRDSFDLTSWTVSGRVANLDLIYTGGFLDREVYQTIDYTDYTFGGGYQVYYLCNAYVGATECFDPRKQYIEDTRNKRFTNEFRVTTDQEARLRFTGGIYLDTIETTSVGEFQYFGSVDAGFDVANNPGNSSSFRAGDPGFQPGPDPVPGVTEPFGHGELTLFMNNATREEDQTAFFGEVSFDIVPELLTFTLGARNYDIDLELTGTTASSFGCKGINVPDDGSVQAGDSIGGNGQIAAERPDGTFGCDARASGRNVTRLFEALGDGSLEALQNHFGTAGGTDIFNAIQAGEFDVGDIDSNGVANESDTIFKATLDITPTDSTLVYLTWSEGFRPLTANRLGGQLANNQSGPFVGYRVPAIAKTDELTNVELGFKGDLFDDSLRLNATFYRSEIDNLQTFRFDPSNIAFLVFVENVGDAEIDGLDLDFQWSISDNLNIYGAASFVDSEITRLNPQLEGLAVPVGSELPYTPEFSFNLRGRYDFELTSFGADAYVQAGIVYTGESKAGIIGNAYFVEDTTERVYGRGSGLQIEEEGTSFGSTEVATEVSVDASRLTTVDGETRFKNGRYVQEDYTVVNLSFGLDKDNWGAELYIDNVTDERGQVHISTQDYSPTVSTNRPRTIGLRFSYDFE